MPLSKMKRRTCKLYPQTRILTQRKFIKLVFGTRDLCELADFLVTVSAA